MRFQNKTVIVTGAASGIGLATAKRFASEGAFVVIADLDQQKCDSAANECRLTGAADAVGVVCDVSDETAVEHCVTTAFAKFNRLDVIVNNAGLMVFKPLVEHTTADWEKVFRVDLLGAFYFTKQAFKRMRSGGAIVNVSSVHAQETTPQVASYAAAKTAILSLTRTAALEGKPLNIRVNAILPGAIDTPMLWENPNIKSGIENVDPAEVGRPEDIAAAIAFLASDDAHFIQGAALLADGGRLVRL
jgi:NAD(P)-dependent dehydrogenase (short-subunit alcohol dehydrogenase family)